jgi:hypothetical protein
MAAIGSLSIPSDRFIRNHVCWTQCYAAQRKCNILPPETVTTDGKVGHAVIYQEQTSSPPRMGNNHRRLGAPHLAWRPYDAAARSRRYVVVKRGEPSWPEACLLSRNAMATPAKKWPSGKMLPRATVTETECMLAAMSFEKSQQKKYVESLKDLPIRSTSYPARCRNIISIS